VTSDPKTNAAFVAALPPAAAKFKQANLIPDHGAVAGFGEETGIELRAPGPRRLSARRGRNRSGTLAGRLNSGPGRERSCSNDVSSRSSSGS
jgi:hypothetical protein